MFLFEKLVLAHLVADFILQFEELYQLKVRHFLGHLLHVFIHGAVMIVLTFPYLDNPLVLLYVIFLVFEHLYQDLIKYRLTQKFPPKQFVYYTLDQMLHFAVLSFVLFFPIASETRSFPGPTLLNGLYQDPSITRFFIFFILLTFAANYTLNSFYQSYVKGSRPLHWITSPEMAIAILERSVIATVIIFAPGLPWILLSLLVGTLRIPFKSLRHFKDFLISAGYTLALTTVFLALA